MIGNFKLNTNSQGKYNVTDKRRFVQAFFLFLYFVFPFFGIFYFNVESSTFVLLGKTIGVNNSVIFVIGFIAIVIAVITMAITTGRSFCGWVCPQNFLSEMTNKVIKKLALKNDGSKKIIPYTVITLGTVLISVAVAINFMFYFGKPADVFNSLISGNLNGNVTIFAIIFGALVFAGIGIFRHDFCKYACPYGIMQSSVADKTTMRVRFTKERSNDCINCGQCNEVCYVDIEPRKLVQADPGCMNCGLCVEACHNVLTPLGVQSTLEFSREIDKEKESLNNKAVLILTSTLIAFSVGFLYMLFSLPTVDLTLTRNDAYVAVSNNGNIGTKYFLQVMNQSSEAEDLELKIEGIPEKYVFLEKNQLSLEQGEKARFQLEINAPKADLKPGITEFNLIAYNKKNNQAMSKVKGSLYVPFE